MPTTKKKPSRVVRPRQNPPSAQHVTVPEFRWQNFRGFEDTGTLPFRPLTVIIGANNSGKTSLIAPLLLLKQTLDARRQDMTLLSEGEIFNAGHFDDMVHDHDIEREIRFSLGLHLHRGEKPSDNGVARGPGSYPPPPGVLNLSFAASTLAKESSSRQVGTVLKQYEVSDIYERRYLSRKLMANGTYDVEDLLWPEDANDEKILKSRPDRFLFTSGGLVGTAVVPAGQRDELRPLELSARERLYMAIVDYIGGSVREFLARATFIGPIRAMPRRTYDIESSPHTSAGPSGERAPELLLRGGAGLLASVNSWVERFEFGTGLRAKVLSKDAFALLVKQASGTEINLADTGFGLSQTFPLIVQAMAAKPGDVLIAEQPEIHLNPKLQCVVADLFAAVVAKGCSVWFETHSEHIFLRLRRLVAERKIPRDAVSVFYVERGAKGATVREVPLTDSGSVPSDQWPIGFFEDSLREALALAHAQSQIVS